MVHLPRAEGLVWWALTQELACEVLCLTSGGVGMAWTGPCLCVYSRVCLGVS